MDEIAPLPLTGGLDARLTLQKLEVFLLVAELGSVTRAAARLVVAQPVVTGHIRTLERRVGATLLERDGNRMVLTPAGRRVQTWARDVLRSARELQRDLADLGAGDAGEAVLTTSMTVGTYLVPPLLVEFQRQRPLAELTLLVGHPQRTIRHIVEGSADIGVLVTDDSLSRPGLAVATLRDEPLVLIGPPSARASTLSVGEIADLQFVCAPTGSARRSMIDRSLRRAGVEQRRVTLQVTSPEAMKTAVRLGSGYAFVFRSAVRDELASGELVEVDHTLGAMGVPLVLVHRAKRALTPMQRQLFEHLRVGLTSPNPPASAAAAQ